MSKELNKVITRLDARNAYINTLAAHTKDDIKCLEALKASHVSSMNTIKLEIVVIDSCIVAAEGVITQLTKVIVAEPKEKAIDPGTKK